MKMEVEIRLISLNCWGLVGVSKHREERMTAIANYLSSADYDFVFLQEIWSQQDYRKIRTKTCHNLPHAHYFHSGVLGSGVCILSRSPIVDTGMLKYNLNGYAHKIFHGDWFGGKVVGLCKVAHRGLAVNLYVTHLHAEYNRHCDVYLSHRICQSFEMSQYVKLTSETCDLTIVAGDFNTEPLDPPYNIILHNTGLEDAFVTQDLNPESMCVGATCGHPENSFTTPREKHSCPTGKRIDYVMYKVGRGVTANIKSCRNPRLKTPSGISISDHEPVDVVMRVAKSTEAASIMDSGSSSPSKLTNSGISSPAHLDALMRGQEQLLQTLNSLHLDRLFYIVAGCFMACVLAATVPLRLPEVYHWLLVLSRTLAALLLGFCVVMGILWNAMERSSTLAARKSMRLLCKSGSPSLKGTPSYSSPAGLSTPTEALLSLHGDLKV